jgi:hypothetical protein
MTRVRRESQDELQAELRPNAEAARERVQQALGELVDASKEWEAVASRYGTLLRGTGSQSFVRGLGLDSLVRDVRRALDAGIAAPVPQEPSVVTWPEEAA